jgi:hypothetical protein
MWKTADGLAEHEFDYAPRDPKCDPVQLRCDHRRCRKGKNGERARFERHASEVGELNYCSWECTQACREQWFRPRSGAGYDVECIAEGCEERVPVAPIKRNVARWRPRCEKHRLAFRIKRGTKRGLRESPLSLKRTEGKRTLEEHARALRKQAATNAEIAELLGCSKSTIDKLRLPPPPDEARLWRWLDDHGGRRGRRDAMRGLNWTARRIMAAAKPSACGDVLAAAVGGVGGGVVLQRVS